MRRAALVVGIDDYQASPLSGCVSDAREVGQLLSANHDGSVNFSVKRMVSSDRPVTRAALREALHQLFAGDFDTALVFFAGHGMITDVGGCIVTQDAVRYDEGISMSDLLAMAVGSRSREIVVILDCCHSGAFGTIPAAANSHAHLREGLSILSASRDSESAVEFDGHGLFTGLVVEALYGGAADLLGRITMADLFAFVDRHLGPWDQRPLFKCHVSELRSLRQCNPRIEASVLRQLPEVFPTPEHVYDLDPSYETERAVWDATKRADYQAIRLYRSVGLVCPATSTHLYYAALVSGGCKLTRLGQYYWHLCEQKRI